MRHVNTENGSLGDGRSIMVRVFGSMWRVRSDRTASGDGKEVDEVRWCRDSGLGGMTISGSYRQREVHVGLRQAYCYQMMLSSGDDGITYPGTVLMELITSCISTDGQI